MKRISYFFERREFEDPKIEKPYYVYKGYYLKIDNDKKYYPVILHFTKDEIIISYKNHKDGKIYSVFSLYVAAGDINQRMLTEKIENYWKMPIWPLSQKLRRDINLKEPDDKKEKGDKDKYGGKRNGKSGKEQERKKLYVDESLLIRSYYSKIYGFDIEEIGKTKRFVELKLFKKTRLKEREVKDDTVTFTFKSDKKGKNLAQNKSEKSTLKLDNETKEIFTHHIDFRRIILDFLYEIDYANTFEDENFFKLQPVIQNNKLLDALTKYGDYLNALYKISYPKSKMANFGGKKELPPEFLKAERAWLNVCFLDEYKEVFVSRSSLFDNVEEEVRKAIFKTQIGRGKKNRAKLFKKEDTSLRNQVATFFLRRYALNDAFKTLLNVPMVVALLVLLSVPLGELLLHKVTPAESNVSLRGIFAVGIPLITAVFLLIFYAFKKINLFRLTLPRLFFGIAIGWAATLTQEVWQTALELGKGKIIVADVILFILIFLYIFTDIRNRLIRVGDKAVLMRAALLLGFAMALSLFQSFYVIQFFGKTMHEIATEQRVRNEFGSAELYSARDIGNTMPKIAMQEYEAVKHAEKAEYENPKQETGPEEHIGILGIKFVYMWPIMVMQFLIAIFIGVILQFLWEDRPVTEPL